jgi:DNA invertase Pin-like site-specific DNA recombinase
MKYIAYYRVSTAKQGKSGLGIEAQQQLVRNFVAANGGEVVAEYTEVESGKKDDRPKLIEAMQHADLVHGKLLVGRLDRLSRDLHFITSLQKSQVDFVIADMPNCDSFTIHIYGALGQKEREQISARTKAALAEAKARGVKLGTNNLDVAHAAEYSKQGVAAIKAGADRYAAKVLPRIQALQAQGLSLRGVAEALNQQGVTTPRGKKWTATAVRNALARVA